MDEMSINITPEQSAMIDRFALGLEREIREIAKAYVEIPNTNDSRQEVLALCLKYGNEFGRVGHIVEELRGELRVHYDALQSELQRRL